MPWFDPSCAISMDSRTFLFPLLPVSQLGTASTTTLGVIIFFLTWFSPILIAFIKYSLLTTWKVDKIDFRTFLRSWMFLFRSQMSLVCKRGSPHTSFIASSSSAKLFVYKRIWNLSSLLLKIKFATLQEEFSINTKILWLFSLTFVTVRFEIVKKRWIYAWKKGYVHGNPDAKAAFFRKLVHFEVPLSRRCYFEVPLNIIFPPNIHVFLSVREVCFQHVCSKSFFKAPE